MSQPPSQPVSVGQRPVLLLTCGDPAGIGPEVVWKAWASARAHAGARLRVVGDADMLADTIRSRTGLPALPIVTVAPDDPRDSAPDAVLMIDSSEPGVAREQVPPATPIRNGRASGTSASGDETRSPIPVTVGRGSLIGRARYPGGSGPSPWGCL